MRGRRPPEQPRSGWQGLCSEVSPLGGRRAVCRAASTAHSAKVGGGSMIAAAAAPYSVRVGHAAAGT